MLNRVIKHFHAIIFACILTMIYYFLPALGISSTMFFAIAYIFAFSIYLFKSSLNFRIDHLEILLLTIFIISFFLFIINIDVYEKPFFNDLLRISYVFLFFGYLKSLKVTERISLFLLIVNYSLFFIIPILSIEYFFPTDFKLFYNIMLNADNIDENYFNSRLAGFIGDSNALSFLLVILMFIFSNSNQKIPIKIIVNIFLLIAIFFSGSRMGLIMSCLLLIRYFGLLKSLIISLFVTFFLVLSPYNELFRDSSNSDNDRLDSITKGWNYLLNSELLSPLGNIFYKYNYLNLSAADHFPHLGFLYLLTEFGIFVLPIFLVLFLLLKKIFYSDIYFFLILLMAIVFLPNQIYYLPLYLALSYCIEKQKTNFFPFSQQTKLI
jgi:hypothetical protein